MKKKFGKLTLQSYPDQEAFPFLPDDMNGKYQPVILGVLTSSGLLTLNKFLVSVPTVLVNTGTDLGSGVWRGRSFKICATVKNPETGNVHGLLHTVGSFPSVIRYQDQIVTTLTEGINYSFSNSNTQIDMNAGNPGDLKDDADIRVDAVQYQDDAVGTFTGTPNASIARIPDVLHFLFVCFLGVPTSKLDLAAFTLTGTIKQGVGGHWTAPAWYPASNVAGGVRAYFEEQIEIQQIINRINFYSDHVVRFGTDGKYTLALLTDQVALSMPSGSGGSGFSGLPTSTLVTDSDIQEFTETYRVDSIGNRILVNYFQIPAGAAKLEYFENKRKKKRKKAKPTVTSVPAYLVERNDLVTAINGVNVYNDFGACLNQEKEITVETYDTASFTPKAFANELYRRWGRGFWQAKFTDINAGLMNIFPGDVFAVHRASSAHGDISDGKRFRLIDGTRFHYNKTVLVERSDEVK